MAMRTPAWRDWTNLGSGPAGLIAYHLLANDVADYVRFRMVCAEWRACSDDPRGQSVFDRRYHPHQWIVSVDGRRRRLLNVSTGEFINLRQPDRGSYFVLGPTAEGLLVRCGKSNLDVQLLNPVTGQVTDLPRDNFPRLQEVRLIGAGMTGDSMIVLLFRAECSEQAVPCDDTTRLAVARPGGKCWIRLRTKDKILSALPFAGRFYCATSKNVLVLQATSSQNPQLVVAAEFGFDTSAKSYICLADIDGKLMLARWYPMFFGQRYSMREVYRVDLEARKTAAMRQFQVHGRAVFVGPYGGRALSLRGGLSPSISSNTIYFCKRQTGNPRMNFDVWRLMDGSVAEDCRTKCTCNIVDHLTRHILGCW